MPLSIIHITLRSAEVHFKELVPSADTAKAAEKEIEVTEDVEIVDKTSSRRLRIRQLLVYLRPLSHGGPGQQYITMIIGPYKMAKTVGHIITDFPASG